MFDNQEENRRKRISRPLRCPVCDIPTLSGQRKQVLIGQETSKAIPVLTSTTMMLLLRSIPSWVCFPKTTWVCFPKTTISAKDITPEYTDTLSNQQREKRAYSTVRSPCWNGNKIATPRNWRKGEVVTIGLKDWVISVTTATTELREYMTYLVPVFKGFTWIEQYSE